ncbi:MAG: hypothetical protein M3290_01385, partial [Actinomycetota bacterium]|nr:hypothetical protein [Actinomycetota bacterium]
MSEKGKGPTMPAAPAPAEEDQAQSSVGDLRARVDKTFEDALDEVSAALEPVRDLLSPPPPPEPQQTPTRSTPIATEAPARAISAAVRKPDQTLRSPEPTIRVPKKSLSPAASATQTV